MTNNERRFGRFMRDGEGHPAGDPPAGDPPVDPPVVDPVDPPADPPKAEEPPAYEPLTADALKLPAEEEGFAINEGLRDEFLNLVNDQNLTPAERAQSLVDLYVKTAKEASEKGSQAWDSVQQQWQEQAMADPDIGGAKLEPALISVSRAIDKFGTPEVREAMDLTGAGNHPAIIKFIYQMAKQFDEGTPVSGQATSGGQSLADKMFPSMVKG